MEDEAGDYSQAEELINQFKPIAGRFEAAWYELQEKLRALGMDEARRKPADQGHTEWVARALPPGLAYKVRYHFLWRHDDEELNRTRPPLHQISFVIAAAIKPVK